MPDPIQRLPKTDNKPVRILNLRFRSFPGIQKDQKPIESGGFALYFKDNNRAGANRTFLEDLYLPLFD
jgi:hypothetical protein